jgi:hypothetical protein
MRGRLNERKDETEKGDAAHQESATPLLQFAAMRGKDIRDRGGEAADGQAGKSDKRNSVQHKRPRTANAPQEALCTPNVKISLRCRDAPATLQRAGDDQDDDDDQDQTGAA